MPRHRVSQPPEDVGEPRIAAQGIGARVDVDPEQGLGRFSDCAVQAAKRRVAIAQLRIDAPIRSIRR
jgi:hypothetical protein